MLAGGLHCGEAAQGRGPEPGRLAGLEKQLEKHLVRRRYCRINETEASLPQYSMNLWLPNGNTSSSVLLRFLIFYIINPGYNFSSLLNNCGLLCGIFQKAPIDSRKHVCSLLRVTFTHRGGHT